MMGRKLQWWEQELLEDQEDYEAWYQTTLEQQEQEELDQNGEKETKS
jgi:hypothetical protein